jgi:predicted transcriptional regulator
MQSKKDIVGLAADIVAAYVGNNAVPASELPALISSIHKALAGSANGISENLSQEELKPAVSVRKSVTPDHNVCLEDGKKFKSLKQHLRSHHVLTPEQYRQRWSLGGNYPMVAPNYAEARAKLARAAGLGQKRSDRKKGTGKYSK